MDTQVTYVQQLQDRAARCPDGTVAAPRVFTKVTVPGSCVPNGAPHDAPDAQPSPIGQPSRRPWDETTITSESRQRQGRDLEQLVSPPPLHGSFGALLRACRRRAMLSQEQLAARAEVSERTVRDLEAGRVQSPRADTVRLLADALKLTGPERESWFAAARRVSHQWAASAPPGAGVPAQMPDDAAGQRPARALGRLNRCWVWMRQVVASLLGSLDSVPEPPAEWQVLYWSDALVGAEPTENGVIPLAAVLRALVHEHPVVGEATPSPARRNMVQAFVPSSFAHDRPRSPARLIGALTNRELEVLQLIAVGRRNREIAQDLFVTLDTVKKHISHILGKLSATNRTHAVTLARELRLIP
jgi:DNA-binding CsgD family transcriptional regulator/transcriptional regulator with XRE-family HTH domain